MKFQSICMRTNNFTAPAVNHGDLNIISTRVQTRDCKLYTKLEPTYGSTDICEK